MINRNCNDGLEEGNDQIKNNYKEGLYERAYALVIDLRVCTMYNVMEPWWERARKQDGYNTAVQWIEFLGGAIVRGIWICEEVLKRDRE